MTRPGQEDTNWGTDTPISLPVPSADPVMVDFGALGMNIYGISHNINSGDIAEYLPTYLPENTHG